MNFVDYKFTPTGTPSTYAISLPDRLKRLEVNVKDFGALGNGVHDDTLNIQAAFDAAFGPYLNPLFNTDRTSIRSVYFPVGTYIITSMLTIRGGDGSHLRGSGRDATRLVYKGPIAIGRDEQFTGPRTMLFRSNGWARMLVDNMSFEMTGAGLTSQSARGDILFSAQPAVGSNIVLNGTTVTFNDGTGGTVNRGANLAACITNLVTFLNASADAQISKCTYTGTAVILHIASDTAGEAMNSFTIGYSTSPASNASIPGSANASSLPGTLWGGQRGPDTFANHRLDKTVCFDWNWDDGDSTQTSGCCWMNCKFTGAYRGFAVGQEYFEPTPGATSTSTVTLGPVATSTTSNNIVASTAKVFTTQTGKSAFFPTGAIIEISMNDPGSPAIPANARRLLMRGKVVSYVSGTGILTVDTATGPDGAAQGDTATVVHPIVAGPLWYIWECRKTWVVPAGLAATFTRMAHFTPTVSPGNYYHQNSFDRPRVVSYDNTTGVLVLNTSAFDGLGTYDDASGVQSNYTSTAPVSTTASSWTFWRWWGYECDASSWINCVMEDCYEGIYHGNQNVINSQFVGGAFRRCLHAGWVGAGGICQTYIGISFEDNGIKQSVLGGILGDDGGEVYSSGYCDFNVNFGTPSVMIGCISTSKNFLLAQNGGLSLFGCRHTNSNPGMFLRATTGVSGCAVEGCFSSNGILAGAADAYISVCDASVSRDYSGSLPQSAPIIFRELFSGDPLHFAQLPPSTWLGQGLVVPIDDATVNTFSTPVTGGSGTFHILLHWNGTGWTVMGK